jgi:hypothetical protein
LLVSRASWNVMTGGHGHDLSGRGNGLVVFVEKRDLHFAIGGDKELRVRIEGGEQAAAVRAGFLLVVVMVGSRGGKRDRECGQQREDDEFQFHGWGFLDGCSELRLD